MAAPVENSQQVKLILSSLAGDIQPAERIIIFNKSQTRVPIGRASKSASKGLLAATDNAWFDSPVMSRKHAELSLDSTTMAVIIQDTGALHGTRLNNALLRPQQAAELVDGDVLVFGAEVRRGLETFPPCSFRINYEKGLSSPSMNTIKFPESSDIEDYDKDEDYTSEYNSDEAEETPLESPDHSYKNISTIKETIDLTEDSDESYVGPRGLSEDEICTDAAAINLEKLRANSTFDTSYETFADEHIEDDKAEVYEDGRSDKPGDGYSEISDSQYSSDEDEDETPQVSDCLTTENCTSDDLGHQIMPHDQNDETNMDYTGDEVPLSPMRKYLDEAEYNTSSDVEGEPPVASNDTNIHDSTGDLAEEHTYESNDSLFEAHFHDRSWSYPNICEVRKVSTDEVKEKADDKVVSVASSSVHENQTTVPTSSTTEENGESTPSSTSLHFATKHFLLDGDLEKVAHKALGDKTGKQVYFEAREKNRETIRNAIDECPLWPFASIRVGGINVPISSIEKKLASSNQASSIAGALAEKSSESQSSLSTQVPSPSKTTKRKADQISTVLEDELRDWEQPDNGLPNKIDADPVPSDMSSARVSVNDDVVSEQRTRKRVKKFAEALGYAALGGVAVGAGLFSVLVATAPEFI